MGRQSGGHDHLFYSFTLESVVPQNLLLRGIDRCLDLTDLRQHLAEYYSHTGRPSIDPVLMIRMLVVGYCYGTCASQRRGKFHQTYGRSRRDELQYHATAPNRGYGLRYSSDAGLDGQ